MKESTQEYIATEKLHITETEETYEAASVTEIPVPVVEKSLNDGKQIIKFISNSHFHN